MKTGPLPPLPTHTQRRVNIVVFVVALGWFVGSLKDALELLTFPSMSHELIHLVRLQNFPKNYHFLPPDTHGYELCEKKLWERTKLMILIKIFNSFEV